MRSIQKTAKLTGFLILLMAFIAPIGMMYVPSTLIVPGDATATANQIAASPGLFRLGIASDSIVFLLELGLCVLLYVLIKPVNHTLALVAAFSRLAMTIIQGMNMLTYFFVLLLLSGADYLNVFAPDQLDALVMLLLNGHETVVLIWGLAFALHLILFGYLVYRSGFLPKLIGGLLIIAGLCYLTQSFGNILFPQYKDLFTTIGLLSMVELALPLWLVAKGVNVTVWNQRATTAA